MIKKIKLFWFGITHVIEITDYLAERIDHAESLINRKACS